MKEKKTGTKVSVPKVASSKPSDDGTAQRRVLLAAVAQSERHRHHADYHRQRCHDDRDGSV